MLELLAASIWMAFMTIFGTRGQNAEAVLPTDPVARSRHQASLCLSILKAELSQASIVSLEPERVRYRAPRSPDERELWCEGGKVKQQLPGARPKTLTQLGDGGSLNFEQVAENQLKVGIVAAPAADVSHAISLRLSVIPLTA